MTDVVSFWTLSRLFFLRGKTVPLGYGGCSILKVQIKQFNWQKPKGRLWHLEKNTERAKHRLFLPVSCLCANYREKIGFSWFFCLPWCSGEEGLRPQAPVKPQRNRKAMSCDAGIVLFHHGREYTHWMLLHCIKNYICATYLYVDLYV